jgi:integrase
MTPFQSHFAEHLAGYVRLRRGLGQKFRWQERLLHAFDQFVIERDYQGSLTQELALEFATAKQETSLNHSACCYQVVRHFSDYLATFVPGTPRLDSTVLRRPKTRPPAYIFTEEQLGALLHEALHVSTIHPLRGITLHAMVGVAASTGMRISEVIRLDKEDVGLDSGVLLIKQTKFAKDRLVPLHPSTREVLCGYAAARDAAFPDVGTPAFFVNMYRKRFAKVTLQMAFLDLTRRSGLRAGLGKGRPSFHSLRHSFAVRRLVAWYKAGIDVQAMLPALATYMGHVRYTNTAYYLTATAELLGLAVEKLQAGSEEVPS